MVNFEYQETIKTNQHFIHTEMQIKVENCLLPFRSMFFKYIVRFCVILSLRAFVGVSKSLKPDGLCS